MKILRREALEQLQRDTSAEIVPVILNRFLGELERRCQDIRGALQDGDAERVGLEAHSIKSAARTFGLDALSEQALTLEAGADDGQSLDDLEQTANGMLTAAELARKALTEYLADS